MEKPMTELTEKLINLILLKEEEIKVLQDKVSILDRILFNRDITIEKLRDKNQELKSTISSININKGTEKIPSDYISIKEFIELFNIDIKDYRIGSLSQRCNTYCNNNNISTYRLRPSNHKVYPKSIINKILVERLELKPYE